jgi:TonB family protein
MGQNIRKIFIQNSFLIALLLHLLFLLSISIVIFLQPTETQKPKIPSYVPSYVYSGKISLSKPVETTQQQPSTVTSTEVAKPLVSKSEEYLPQKSVLQMSREVLQQDQFRRAIEKDKTAEPMLLIGEFSEYADPLIKQLGRSLSANFKYPEMEGRFGVKGRVLVEMTLHPDGNFSDVRVVESSNNNDFDTAALYAVNKAPRVRGADRLLSKPKHLVVGFIFN